MKTAILHHGTRFVPHLAQISSLLGWSASALGRTSHPSRYWSPFNSLSLSVDWEVLLIFHETFTQKKKNNNLFFKVSPTKRHVFLLPMLLNDIYIYLLSINEWSQSFFIFFSNHLNLHPPIAPPPFPWMINSPSRPTVLKYRRQRGSFPLGLRRRCCGGKTWWVFWGNPLIGFFFLIWMNFLVIYVFFVSYSDSFFW